MKKLLFLLLFAWCSAQGQSFLNGTFEDNSCTNFCYDNLSNGAFNGLMNNVHAWGSASEPDIYWKGGCSYFPASNPNWFIVLDVLLTKPIKYDAVNIKLDNNLVAGNEYIFSCYVAASTAYTWAFGATPLDVGISNSNNTQGTVQFTIPAPTSTVTWTPFTKTFTATATGLYMSIMASGDDLHRWTAIDDVKLLNPLPVGLLSFTGEAKDTTNFIEWRTASETNNDYFLLIKNGDYVKPIAKIYGNGSTDVESVYQFTDDHVSYFLTYYSLVQVDRDGKKNSMPQYLLKIIT